MGAATTLVVLATWGCWGKTSRDEASDAGEGPVAGAGGALVAAAGGAAGRAGGDAGGGPVSFDEGNYDFCQHWAFERASETCSVGAPQHGPPEGKEPERALRLPAQRAPGGLLENEPRARGPCSYLGWAELLKRTHDVDALRCPCGGRYRFVQLFTASQDAREALEKRGLDHQPPPIARSRAPDLFDVPANHGGDIPPPDCFIDPPAPDCIDPPPADW